MLSLDHYAYLNRLRHAHPGEKLAFAMVTMVITLAAPSPLTPLATILLMSGVAIMGAGIPWRFYLKLMALPLSFLLLGVTTIAVSLGRHPTPFIYGVPVGELTVGVAPRDLATAMMVFCRSLGAVSCLYFLSLTTPLTETIAVLRKLRVPAMLVELMILVYRFIFVLMETANGMYVAQSSRCGYATIRTSYFSLGQLISNLFLKSLQRSRLVFTALQSRCYTGELKVLEQEHTVSVNRILLMAIADLALIALTLSSL